MNFIKTEIEARSLTIVKDYIDINNTSTFSFNEVFGIKNGNTYTPFTSNYELYYDTLTVDKDIEFCNLGKLSVGKLTIKENKKLTVSSGTIKVTGDFKMENGSTIQCKKLSF